MNIFERLNYKRRLKFLVNETVRVLGISRNEAEKRVLRVAGMEELKELGTPDTKEYQTAVDIIMQIPSDEPVTISAMKKIVDAQEKNKNL